MIGQIGPLVQAGKQKTLLALHLSGGILGGAGMGLALGFIGVVIGRIVNLEPVAQTAILAAVLLYAGAVDLRVLPAPELSPVRQTPGWWPCSMGNSSAIFSWGVDLGLGMTTRFPHQALLVLPTFALVMQNVALSVAAFALYGAGRATAVGLALLHAHDPAHACDRVAAGGSILRLLVGSSAVVIAAMILTMVL